MASMSYRELVALFRKNGIEFVRAAKGDHVKGCHMMLAKSHL